MKKSFLLFVVFAVFSFAIELPTNKVVDVAWVKKNMTNPNVVLIMLDGNGKVFEKEHIPGSVLWAKDGFVQNFYKDVSIDLPSPLQFTRLAQKSGINDDSVVVFYGTNVNFKEGARALEGLVIADYYGVKNIAVLKGGLATWKKAGEPVSSDVSKPQAGNFKITKMNDVIATVFDIDRAVETKSATLIDARPEKYYLGKDDDKRLKKHGHIDGALSIQTESLYNVEDGIATMKDAAELEKIFKDSGVDLTKPIISYCNTGHLTSGVWFAAKYILGAKDVKNYKASMVEYSAMPQRKVTK